MIKNFIVTQQRDKLFSEKDILVTQKKETETLLIQWNKKKQECLKHGTHLPDELKIEKQELLNRVSKIDVQITRINGELRKINDRLFSEETYSLINLFKEIFEPDQIKELYAENKRRMAGEPPVKVSFNWKEFQLCKENLAIYKKLAKEQIEKMIEFRLELTGLIDRGCDQFGKPEFLKFISPLNKLIIPVNELKKIKVKHHL